MSDYLSRGFNGSCIGTVAGFGGGLVAHPLTEFAARIQAKRETGMSSIAFARSTTVTQLVKGAPQAAMRDAPFIGCAFAALEVVSYGGLGLNAREDNVWTRFGKAATGGCVGGVLEAGMAGAAPRIPAAALSRAVFFGIDAAVRPTVEVREREQQRVLYVPRLAVGWYSAAVARVLSQPLWAVCDAAHASNTSLPEAGRALLRKGGVAGLYRGMGTSVLGAVGGATTLVIYNLLRDLSPSL